MRVALRFMVVYLGLYLAPFPLDAIPIVGERIDKAARVPWYSVVPWVGTHLLRLHEPIRVVTHGASDSPFQWVKLVTIVLVASVASATWSFVQRSDDDSRLAGALRVYVRYYLAFALLSYGLFKLFRAQFGAPEPDQLVREYGQSTPAQLLIVFMGYSRPYNVFTGLAESLAGTLLLWRRTTLLGALLSVGVLANVVMMNLCYDFPLKTYSITLLALAVGLVAPDAKRCADLLLLNRAIDPAPQRSALPAVWMERARIPVKTARDKHPRRV